jgi:hypothetical protein
VAEAGKVGDIYAEIFGERFGVFAPGCGALAAAVDYQQRFALPPGEIAYVKVANCNSVTIYVARLLFLS